MRRTALVSALLTVAAALAAADEPKPPAAPAKAPDGAAAQRAVADGKLVDPTWSLTYELPGLTESMAPGAPAKLLDGKAGDLSVEILVQEGDRARTAKEWRDEAKKAWAEKKREMKDAVSGDAPVPWETFVEKSLSGFERHHGYGFYLRGLQLFVVHAWANAKTETSGAALAKALAALKLGEDRGASVAAQMIAKSAGKPADSAEVLLAAGQAYVTDRARGGAENPAMAEAVLTRALPKLGELPLDQQYGLHELLGLATLMQRKTDAAIGWFGKAVEHAAKTSQPDQMVSVSTYNLACSYSVAGKLDDAFKALEKSFSKSSPVDADHLKSDPDLENLRKDKRWEAFLAKRPGAEGGK